MRACLGLFVALVFALPAIGQEKSVNPGINKSFQNPDVEQFVGRFERDGRDAFDHREEILKALELKPGMAVADVGAGTGLFSRMFAKSVGPKGTVYAVDIAEVFVKHVEQSAEKAGHKNVVGVVCSADSVKLPPASIDLAYICDTYHHFEFPHKTMRSIHKALKPGGQVVLVDFERIEGKSSEWILGHVRAGQEVFTKEILEAGFRQVEEKKGLLDESYFVRFEKIEDKASAKSQPPYDVFPEANPPYYRVRYQASTQPGELPYPVNYTVWIPPGVKTVRGVVVHQHGCGEGSCSSGLTGAFDLHWQALAKKHACALLAPSYEQPGGADCQMWCDPRNGSAAAFQNGLKDLGRKSGHPELAKVPWALWGHSGGGHWAGGMVLLYPDRVAAAWLRSGVPLLKPNPDRPTIKSHALPKEALKVPIMCNPGTKEGVTVKDGRFSKVWPANQEFFGAVRSEGGLIGVAVDPLTAHECGNQRYLAIPWLDHCLSVRLPKEPGGKLREMLADAAYLAPVTGSEAVPAKSFNGDPLKAGWLPIEDIARAWMQYVKDTAVTDDTPPPAPTNVRVKNNVVTWEAEADLESGLAGFIIERDGKFLAKVPEEGKNRFGRPIFQNLQYSDTPTQPLVPMRFDDKTAEPGKRHSYRVIAVNTVGLKSARTEKLSTTKPESVGLSSAKLEKVTELMNAQVQDGKIAGGVVAIARRGRVVYFESYGKRDLAAGKPMEKDTIVRLYSMTKAIATAAAMMLVDEGKLKPEDPASKYIPVLANVKVWTPDGLVQPKRPITVADLMRHTAGFGRDGDDAVGKALKKADLRAAKDLNDYVERLATVPLAYHPGESWMYSSSVTVLGLVVQNVSGKPFGEFLSERIFEPLGMPDTAFYVPAQKLNRFAVNYTRSRAGLKPIENFVVNEKYHSPPAVESGGGGLVGTAGDYMRFLLMIANGGEWDGKRYLSPESINLMTTNQLPRAAFPIRSGSQVRHGIGFSFGFSVRTSKTERDQPGRLGEYGWGGAASTHYWVSPKDDGLIVVTLEQIVPYNSDTERLLKPVIYDAVVD